MLDFGPLAADQDPLITDYFHTTRQIATLLRNPGAARPLIYIVRQGGGKSALVTWLKLAQHNAVQFHVLTPRTARFSATVKDTNPSDDRLIMQAELLHDLIKYFTPLAAADGPLTRSCRLFLTETWAKGILAELGKDASVEAFGFAFSLPKAGRAKYLRALRNQKATEKASTLITKLATIKPLALALDDPEYIVSKGSEETSRPNARRIGALLSALADIHTTGVHVLTFLKEHIYQAVRAHYPDAVQIADQAEGLEWDAEDLLALLRLRVRKRLKLAWGDVFEPTDADLIKHVLPFLINGPRDLLYICNTAGKVADRITLGALQRGIGALKSDKWQEIETQYGQQWTNVSRFAQSVLAVVERETKGAPMPPNDFSRIVLQAWGTPGTALFGLRSTAEWIKVAGFSSPTIPELLFVIGCLCYTYQGTTYYPWTGRSFERFTLADTYSIAPLFASTMPKTI